MIISSMSQIYRATKLHSSITRHRMFIIAALHADGIDAQKSRVTGVPSTYISVWRSYYNRQVNRQPINFQYASWNTILRFT